MLTNGHTKTETHQSNPTTAVKYFNTLYVPIPSPYAYLFVALFAPQPPSCRSGVTSATCRKLHSKNKTQKLTPSSLFPTTDGYGEPGLRRLMK
jgi:hypothetical protein